MLKSGPDAHRNHVLCHLLAETDACVVTLGFDIGEAIVDGELDLDVGIARQQPGQHGPENRFRRMLAGRDPDRARGLVPQRAQRSQFGVDLLEAGPKVAEQPFARFGRSYAARGAHQEPYAQPLLEFADAVAQRRLRYAQFCGGAGEAALARYREKAQEVVEVPAH
jgi:hypothetical protein